MITVNRVKTMKALPTDQVERRGVALAMDTFENMGFAFREQHQHDYGIDAHVELIDDQKPTGQLLALQIKAGSSYFSEATVEDYVYRPESKHVNYWLNHSLPVFNLPVRPRTEFDFLATCECRNRGENRKKTQNTDS